MHSAQTRLGCEQSRETIQCRRANLIGSALTDVHPESNQVREYRLRRDHPDLEYDFAGNLNTP
jgi:hypothetical protein